MLAANLSRKAAEARVVQARGRLLVAESSLWPQASLQASVSRTRTNVQSFAASLGGDPSAGPSAVTNTRYSVSTPLSYELDLWGKLWNIRKAAQFELEASTLELEALLNSLSADTVEFYLLGLELCQQVSVLEQSAELDERVYNLALRRYEMGIADPLDVFQAKEVLSARRASLPAVQQQLFENSTRLQVLAGVYPKGFSNCELEITFPADFPAVAIASPAALLARRPDLVAAEAQLAAADLRYRAAAKEFLPSLILSFSPGYEGLDVSQLFHPDTFVWNLVSSLSTPLFDGGRLRGERLSAKGRSVELYFSYIESALTAFSEVENALSLVKNTRLALERREENSRAATETFRIASRQYAGGLADYVPVLLAQTRKLEAEQQLVSAKRELLSSRVALARALGGGWTQRETAGETRQ